MNSEFEKAKVSLEKDPMDNHIMEYTTLETFEEMFPVGSIVCVDPAVRELSSPYTPGMISVWRSSGNLGSGPGSQINGDDGHVYLNLDSLGVVIEFVSRDDASVQVLDTKGRWEDPYTWSPSHQLVDVLFDGDLIRIYARWLSKPAD